MSSRWPLESLAMAVMIGAGAGGGCEEAGGRGVPAVQSFRVTVNQVQVLGDSASWQEVDLATLEQQLFPVGQPTKVAAEVQAVPERSGFDGFVRVSVRPGKLRAVVGAGEALGLSNLRVTAQEPTPVEVEFEGAYGDTRVTFEDVGLVVGDPSTAACNDGVDNDGDGLADFEVDPGCYYRNDDSEQPGSHAVGVTDVFHFENPRLSQVQGCGHAPTLDGQSVTVDRGRLYVTAVTVGGFYVTDYGLLYGGCDQASGCCEPGRYAHIYAYNYNTPYGLRVCDRLERFEGIVTDFYGFTELNFPSWQLFDLDGDPSNGLTLMRLPPREITAEDCPLQSQELAPEMLTNRPLMESFEAALVHVEAAELPSEWVDCDLNGNGEVAYRREEDRDQFVPADEARVPAEYCTPDAQGRCSEALCQQVCSQRGCAELTTYREYGQYPVRVQGVPILAVSRSNVPEFDPRRQAATGGRTVARLGGVLKEFGPLDTPWIIEPRCRQDILLDGVAGYSDVPVYRRCVPSEDTGEYEDPM